MDTYDAIARRTSTRAFRPDPVPRYVIERLLAAAVRAPNHKLTEPWSFVVLIGEAKRRFAELRREHRRRRFNPPDSEQADRAAEKTWREHLDTPAFIFVMCAVSDDPVRREEDYGAAMMAVENLLIAASADGLGTFLRTGGIIENPEVKKLVGVPEGHRIVGIISLGYLAEPPEPTPRRKPLSELVRWLD
jgi:nitroreductase